MDSMSDMERRCLKAYGDAIYENDDATPFSVAIVRAVLAEAGVAELVKAATYLRDDMLERAKREAWQHNGDIVVEAGACAWLRFNRALTKIGANQ